MLTLLFISEILSTMDQNMFKAINILRKEKGLNILVRDPRLDKVCDIRAQKLGVNDGKIPEDADESKSKAYLNERMKMAEFDTDPHTNEMSYSGSTDSFKELFDIIKEMDPDNSPFLKKYELIGIAVSKAESNKTRYWDILLAAPKANEEEQEQEEGNDDEHVEENPENMYE